METSVHIVTGYQSAFIATPINKSRFIKGL
jgi:hypothetical protein